MRFLCYVVRVAVIGSCTALAAISTQAQTCKSENCIVTGGPKGTYSHMANDLKRQVVPELSVLESSGSYDNLQRLATEPGVSFAMVQADVLNYVQLLIKSEPDAARAEAFRGLLSPLRVMLPLHEEELHVLVHKDSKLKYLHEIEGQRIFMGRVNSGSYITGKSVYELMFGKSLGANEVGAAQFKKGTAGEEIDAALINLGKLPQGMPEPVVDVVMLVGGQPYTQVKNLENSKQVASQYRFLTLDPQHALTKRLLERYRNAALKAEHYPEISKGRDATATLGVPAYLVTASFKIASRNRFVQKLADGYCRNYSAMANDPASHPKWKTVLWKPGGEAPKLVPGWNSVPPEVLASLERCDETPRSPVPVKTADNKGPCFPNPRNPAECITN